MKKLTLISRVLQVCDIDFFHNYEGINEDYLWEVVDFKLSELVEILDSLIDKFKSLL